MKFFHYFPISLFEKSFTLSYNISVTLSMDEYEANFNPISPGNKGLS